MRNVWQTHGHVFIASNYATALNKLGKLGPPPAQGAKVQQRYTQFLEAFIADVADNATDFSTRAQLQSLWGLTKLHRWGTPLHAALLTSLAQHVDALST